MQNILQSFPIFTPSSIQVHSSMFDVPDSQFVSRTTNTLWIQQNKSSNEDVNKILTKRIKNMIEQSLHISQEQEYFANMESDLFQSDNEEIDDCVNSYHEQFALFKRAHSLCSNRIDDHKELYTLLSNFVHSKEINHNDNQQIIEKRKIGNDVIISSNKVVNCTHRSTKRTKALYEK